MGSKYTSDSDNGYDSFREEINSVDPGFFERSLAHEPKIMWIGCADARAPESAIYGPEIQVFVHRNIANQFPSDNTSAIAVLEHALVSLEVEHIIIMGHTDCGGVRASLPSASLDESRTPQLHKWLTDLRALGSNTPSLGDDPLQTLTRLNVIKQFENVCQTDVLKRARADGRKVWVHGCIFDINERRSTRIVGPEDGTTIPGL